MTNRAIRTDPPSDIPNNQDVFVWALYLLGGADKDVDVEDIFVKCFEMAPARLGWRTKPGIPDYKKVSKALQSVEAKTHIGLLLHTNKYSRRLTNDGVRWVKTYESILKRTYSDQPVRASKASNTYERRRHEIRSSEVWKVFQADANALGPVDFASVLQCSAASSLATWASRINDVKRAADVLQDDEMMSFALLVERKIMNGEIRNNDE